MKAGYVALIGRPNVGKSTLLNRLVGQKLSIVSRRPQTTRHQILGIKTTAQAQIAYVDTPGIHQHRVSRALNRYLNKAASSALLGVDVAVWLIDGRGVRDDDQLIWDKLGEAAVPTVLAINKVDLLADKKALLPVIDQASRSYPLTAIVPVSALEGTNLDRLEQVIIEHLPESPLIFPEDQLTDKPMRFFAAEIVREKLFYYLGDEVPHQLTVEIEAFKEEKGLARIYAVIWVERPGQKKIVIGKHGELLKRAGQRARLELEEFLGLRVYLNLWVKVKPGWSDDERALKQLGYVA